MKGNFHDISVDIGIPVCQKRTSPGESGSSYMQTTGVMSAYEIHVLLSNLTWLTRGEAAFVGMILRACSS